MKDRYFWGFECLVSVVRLKQIVLDIDILVEEVTGREGECLENDFKVQTLVDHRLGVFNDKVVMIAGVNKVTEVDLALGVSRLDVQQERPTGCLIIH